MQIRENHLCVLICRTCDCRCIRSTFLYLARTRTTCTGVVYTSKTAHNSTRIAVVLIQDHRVIRHKENTCRKPAQCQRRDQAEKHPSHIGHACTHHRPPPPPRQAPEKKTLPPQASGSTAAFVSRSGWEPLTVFHPPTQERSCQSSRGYLLYSQPPTSSCIVPLAAALLLARAVPARMIASQARVLSLTSIVEWVGLLSR